MLQKSIRLWKYKESTQVEKVKLSSEYLTGLFLFFIYRICVSGAEDLSAFCAQHQFLLNFYIYFFYCNTLSISSLL